MSDTDFKARIRRAIESFEERTLKKSKGPTRRNAKPEKEVELACVTWMRSQGWDVNIFEAKATYDPRRGIYRQQSMAAGVLDCGGNTSSGHACWIEFKAPGRLSTVRDNQRQFMFRKIESGAFVCVVDSADRLRRIYTTWRTLLDGGDTQGAKVYLVGMIPAKRFKDIQDRGVLFE